MRGLAERFHEARVLVLGDVMLDRFIYGSIDRISPEAPIPVLAVQRQFDMPGGAANVARNIASIGASATLIGVVGDDLVAKALQAQLALIPTIATYLVVDASRSTTLKTRFVADRQQVMRADREDCHVLAASVAQRVLIAFQQALDATDIVVLSDYAKGVLSESLTRQAIAAARAAGKRVIVDPKYPSFAKYAGASVLTPNRQELERASGRQCTEDDAIGDVAGTMLAGVCDAMVVTRGARGMSVITKRDAPIHILASAREVFDVSGAGDTAVAALAVGLACGGSLVDAARLANVAAGLVVAKTGTAVVSAREVMAATQQIDQRSSDDRLFTLENVAQIICGWRAQGLTVALANGCFDLLHTGHLHLLQQARSSADRLIVALNSDHSVRRLKGPGRPVQGEVVRATLLSSLKTVDAVVIFPEDTPLQLIESLQPDVLIKGAEYSVEQIVGADLVLARGGRVVLVDILADQSTSDTVARMLSACDT